MNEQETLDFARSLTAEQLLFALLSKGGPLAALAEAAAIAVGKTSDYDDGLKKDMYFPMGLVSYAQMLHVKSLRLVSLAAKEMKGGERKHESARDTCLDLINYASFAADWLAREEKSNAAR